MPAFWLDANVFITPNRLEYYSFELAPTFWQLLEQKANDGILASPTRVYDELVRRGDDLAKWAKARQNTSLFVEPDQSVQKAFTAVADYVMNNYQYHRAEEFLGGADPWVIAHAMVDNAKVVTYETKRSLIAQEPKIPNVCQAFEVIPITLFEMFRELSITLEFRG